MRKNSCDGSPSSRRSSPHDTSNLDENHNDEDLPQEPNGASIAIDLVKKFDCDKLPLSNRASPTNLPIKPEPLNSVYPHLNSNIENEDDDDDNDTGSQWDRGSDPSPPASLFQPPFDFEDSYPNPHQIAKLLGASPLFRPQNLGKKLTIMFMTAILTNIQYKTC